MNVRWLKTALKNLEDEAEFIAEHNYEAAVKTVSHIRQAVNHLAEHPESGRIGRVSGTRELVVTGTSYIIPYRIRNESVEILRVLHTSRKWPNRF